MAGFSALPAAVQWRVVQLIEAREDEADARELQAIQEARSADFNPDELLTIEEYMARRRMGQPQPDLEPRQLAA